MEGVLVNSIGATDVKTSMKGDAYAYVKFMGSDSRAGHLQKVKGKVIPMSNKFRAFVIDNSEPGTKNGIYGRHKSPDKRYKGTRGDHFITKQQTGAHDMARNAANDAMLSAW